MGFVGIGKMGSCMSTNLAKKFELHIFDMNDSNLVGFRESSNVTICQSIENLKHMHRVFLMLPDENAVTKVCSGELGLFNILQNGSRIYDCSTISPKTSVLLHNAGLERDIGFIDAPVSGGNRMI